MNKEFGVRLLDKKTLTVPAIPKRMQ